MNRPVADPRSLMRRALRQCDMLREWPEAAMEQLLDGCTPTSHARDTEVLAGEQAQAVLVVASGQLEVSGSNAEGDRFVLSVLGPGEIVGLVALLGDAKPGHHYVVRESCVLVHIPSRLLRAVLDAHPLLWRDVALVALARQQGNIALMQTSALAPLQQRLAQVLVRLAKWSGKSGAQALTLQVSQSDLAAMVAVTRQTVNKELRSLVQRQVVAVSYGQITLLDLPALRELAEGAAAARRERGA